jgi:predicted ATPase
MLQGESQGVKRNDQMHVSEVEIHPERFPAKDFYPFNLPVFYHKTVLSLNFPVTFFIGENGTGKSTLLEAIADKCGIYSWQGIEQRRFNKSPYERDFYRVISIQWTNGSVPGSLFSSRVFRNFAKVLDDWASSDPKILDYFGGKSLMNQSHGQSLMSFFSSRFKIKGLYLLDEPETALSPKSQLALLRILNDMGNAGHAQFIIATHSPILLACPGAAIYSFDQTPIHPTAYEETDYYRIYKEFMEDREAFLYPLDE